MAIPSLVFLLGMGHLHPFPYEGADMATGWCTPNARDDMHSLKESVNTTPIMGAVDTPGESNIMDAQYFSQVGLHPPSRSHPKCHDIVVGEKHVLHCATELHQVHHYHHDYRGIHHCPVDDALPEDMAQSLSFLAEVAATLTHVAKDRGIQPACDHKMDDIVGCTCTPQAPTVHEQRALVDDAYSSVDPVAD